VLTAPLGTGTEAIVQPPPVVVSINWASVPVALVELPTAVQWPGDAHDTLLSPLLVTPVGTGAVCADHPPPPPRSTNAPWLFLSLIQWPTATQLPALGHDTP